MKPESERSSLTRKRKWWLLLAGGLVFLVILTWVEGMVRHDREKTTTTAEGARDARPLAPPEVVRLEEGGIEIRYEFSRDTTLRVMDREKEDALFDCLTEGIARRFEDGTEGWTAGIVEGETLQVQFECLRSIKANPAPP
jgi:hypothetical protein